MACGRVLAADGRALPHVLNTSGQTPAALAALCGHTEMASCLAEYESSARRPVTGQFTARAVGLAVSREDGRDVALSLITCALYSFFTWHEIVFFRYYMILHDIANSRAQAALCQGKAHYR